MAVPRPWNLVAELTYRCPLRCPYCSNPLEFREVRDALDSRSWARAFREAAALGVVHVGLTGGEPSVRSDLEEIVRAATQCGLYVHLVTGGVPLEPERLERLSAKGLRSLQLSIQDVEPAASDELAGAPSFERKLAVAQAARRLRLFVTLNVVLHRGNLPRLRRMIELARQLGVDRIELAHAQYDGWALLNRDALLPSADQIDRATQLVQGARRKLSHPEILLVRPDYFSGRPKPCMGGWGRTTVVVAPDGCVLPCHAARGLPDLEFWNLRDAHLQACWENAPGMNRFRGEAWMREPCRTCPERGRDFGGCRCQAFRLTGDPSVTDPACSLSPDHALIDGAQRAAERDGPHAPLRFRGAAISPPPRSPV